MKDYICKGCSHNNNGWCMKLKKNGLTKIQECEHVKNEQIKDFKIERTTKDYYGQQFVEVTINDEVVSFPEIILKEFIENQDIKSKKFRINYNE